MLLTVTENRLSVSMPVAGVPIGRPPLEVA
jgi:hypothetical protein